MNWSEQLAGLVVAVFRLRLGSLHLAMAEEELTIHRRSHRPTPLN